MSTRQTTEQKRARQAMECVSQVKKQPKDTQREYSSLARSAPAYIQSNGLGQTLAFWYSKGWEKGSPKEPPKSGSGSALLYQDVSAWVCVQMSGWKDKDLLTQLTVDKTTTADYRRATAEAQAFLVWLKRFAEAELGEGG